MSNSRTSESSRPSGRPDLVAKLKNQLGQPKEAVPTGQIPCIAKASKDVGDYVMIAILTPQGERRTIILHHPIGMTGIEKTSWVLSDPSDVSYLIARTGEDSRAKWMEFTHEKALRSFIRKKGEASGLTLVNDKDVAFYHSKHIRKVEMSKAQKKLSGAQKEAKGSAGPKAPLLTYLADPSDRMDEELFSRLKEEFSEFLKYERERNPFTFETKSGVLNDKPQIAATGFSKILSTGSLVDCVVHGLQELAFREKRGSSTSGSTVRGSTEETLI